ncbi:MAG: hypothetical protein JWM74_3479 [Myxococcaceae bacterium]|nr:hypothetical protein [Myxococcaceae bacterium]
MLSFQRLDVYRCAIDFLALATRVGAALSLLGAIAAADHEVAIALLGRLVAMFTKLAR